MNLDNYNQKIVVEFTKMKDADLVAKRDECYADTQKSGKKAVIAGGLTTAAVGYTLLGPTGGAEALLGAVIGAPVTCKFYFNYKKNKTNTIIADCILYERNGHDINACKYKDEVLEQAAKKPSSYKL